MKRRGGERRGRGGEVKGGEGKGRGREGEGKGVDRMGGREEQGKGWEGRGEGTGRNIQYIKCVRNTHTHTLHTKIHTQCLPCQKNDHLPNKPNNQLITERNDIT